MNKQEKRIEEKMYIVRARTGYREWEEREKENKKEEEDCERKKRREIKGRSHRKESRRLRDRKWER